MNDTWLLRAEVDDDLGTRYVVEDEEGQTVLMSTKYYPTFREAYRDLLVLKDLLKAF